MHPARFLIFLAPVSAAACIAGELDVGGGGGCSEAAGTTQSATSLAQAYDQVRGRWLVCTGLNEFHNFGAPSDVVGVEFAPGMLGDASCGAVPAAGRNCGGGNMYYLVQGPSGLARGQGFAYQLTYDIMPDGYPPGSWYSLDLHPWRNSGWSTSFFYSPSPRQLELTSLGYEGGPTLGYVDGIESDASASADATESGACPPAGTVATIDTVSQAAAVVAGRWQVCTGQTNVYWAVGQADVVGMEFAPATPGGGACALIRGASPLCSGATLYLLVEGDAGLVRGPGANYEVQYALDGSGPTLFLEFVYRFGGFGSTGFRYSPSPRELELTVLGDMGSATMLPIP